MFDSTVVQLLCLLVMFPTTSSTWSVNNFMLSGHKFPVAGMYADSVAAGASLGFDECRDQFKWDRWNCDKSAVNIFYENNFPSAIREVAFMNAVVSAGVMHTLTTNCSRGNYQDCACDSSRSSTTGEQNWKWGGCNDNIAFGERVSRESVDKLETGLDARAIVNLHNNEAGRRAVRRNMKLTCKCHGVSGSCSIRTCWKELSSFAQVGNHLKRKYLKAIIVDAQNGQITRGSNSQRVQNDMLQVSANDLVYLEISPEFCHSSPAYGAKGTLNRECSRPLKVNKDNKRENKSCKRLCNSCGLKVKRDLVRETSTCNCKFHWCCEVKCEECTQQVEKLSCVSTR